MSDLGPVNPLFNAQLKVLRESLLPKALHNWESLSDKRKNEISNMGNFFVNYTL